MHTLFICASLQTGLPERRDLDFDVHARVEQVGGNHRGGRTHLAEILAQHRPAPGELAPLGQDVGHANHVAEAGSGLLERRRNVPEALLGLLLDALRDRHGCVVESRRPGNEDPVALHHGTGIGDLFLESRTGADEFAFHDLRRVLRALKERRDDVVHQPRGQARRATVRVVARGQLGHFRQHDLRPLRAVARPFEQIPH